MLNLLSSYNFNPIADSVRNVLAKLPMVVVEVLIGYVLIRICIWLAEAILGLVRLPKGLRGILISLIHTILWIFLIIMILRALGLSSLALVFSGSVAAIGFALVGGASSFASDVLAGVFLAHDKDFNVGDLVRAGDDKTEGIIEAMDMRRTRVRAKDGKLHIIPNSVIERKEWILLEKKTDRTK